MRKREDVRTGRGTRIPPCLLIFHHFFHPCHPKNDGDLIFQRPRLPRLTFFIRVFNPSTWIRLERRHGGWNYRPPGIVPRKRNRNVAASNEGIGGMRLRLVVFPLTSPSERTLIERVGMDEFSIAIHLSPVEIYLYICTSILTPIYLSLFLI